MLDDACKNKGATFSATCWIYIFLNINSTSMTFISPNLLSPPTLSSAVNYRFLIPIGFLVCQPKVILFSLITE